MRIFFTSLLLFLYAFSHAQSPHHRNTRGSNVSKINYNGLWRGSFNESRDSNSTITYVLELEIDGSVVGGYSYTYFNEPPHKYYTICRVNGTLNRATGDLVVTEVERLRYNTPPTFLNCFQTHRLHYHKKDSKTEILQGTWEPAPNQGQGCGTGVTVLSKRIMDKMPMGAGATAKSSVAMTPQKHASTARPAPAPARKPATATPKEEVAKKEPERPRLARPDVAEHEIGPPVVAKKVEAAPKVNSRRNDIVKTIVISEPTFKVDFYDNGEIDGDSISVYYNGKVVLSRQMLTDKPLTLVLPIDKDLEENVLTMYAENLGSIPPNTAVMIVTDGRKRYEVRLESDLKKSGSVIFKPGQ